MEQASQTTGAPPARKIVVAICLRHYLPGYKSGGPVRTISNLVEHLGDEFDFRIVTSDRDIHDAETYSGVAIDAWQTVGKARVYYASPASQSLARITKVLNDIEPDVVYLNSFFDSRFTILPLLARRLGLLRQRRVIVAPRGEFAESALRIRWWKKMPYRMLTRLAGLYSGVVWHASSEFEQKDIVRRMGARAGEATSIAVNLPAIQAALAADDRRPREPGEPLRVVFVSRIAPMKNLDYALRVVAASPVALSFDIYGMIDDQAYWARCRGLMAGMPRHVTITYHGPLPHEQVCAVLARHDVLFLPTLGENYGHVIAEALSQGTPVLISDRTPWRDLQQAGVGWDLPLDENGRGFVSAIRAVAEMDPASYETFRRRAAQYARTMLAHDDAAAANRRLFMMEAAVLHGRR